MAIEKDKGGTVEETPVVVAAETPTTAAAETPTAKESAAAPVSTYTKKELVAAAKTIFDVKPEIMAGALYGMTEAITVDKAKTLLAEFRKKEVK